MVVSSRPRSRRHFWIICLVFLLVLTLICQGRVVSIRFEMTLQYFSNANDLAKQHAPSATMTTHGTSQKNTTGPFGLSSALMNGPQVGGANEYRPFVHPSMPSQTDANRLVSNSTNAMTKTSKSTMRFGNPLHVQNVSNSTSVTRQSSKTVTTLNVTQLYTNVVSLGRLFLSRNDSSSSSSRQGRNTPISIVVQLSGEMGNNLHKIAMGRAIQHLAKDRYDIETVLVLQRQERGSKWVSARRDIQDCFPNLRSLDFELGNGPEFVQRSQQQQEWLGPEGTQLLQIQDHSNTTATRIKVDRALEFLHGLLEAKHEKKWPQSVMEVEEDSNANNISLPFLYSQAFVDFHFIDRYYSDFLQLFTLDEASCCSSIIRPDADESVFVSISFHPLQIGPTGKSSVVCASHKS
jgi:hypothetical protein